MLHKYGVHRKVRTGDEKLDFSLQATTDLDFCFKMERDYQIIWSDCLNLILVISV